MLDTPLKDAKSFKDLGVTISKDLSWDNHISITVRKANNLLGLIKRSFGTTSVMFSQRCIYLWYDQFVNTLYPFGALASSRTFAPWRVYKEGHLD